MQPAAPTIDRSECDAVIFDMDGVVTRTARVHARAWKRMFDDYLRERAEAYGEPFRAFDPDEDYARYVDGKPRYDGVQSFLASRGIELERGSPDDDPQRETVCGLGNRKNERFLRLLRDDGVERFDDAVELCRALHRAGIRTAVFSSSRNAREVLERAGVTELFAARVDGVTAEEAGLPGKPAPDVLIEAARRVGAGPERCAVLEDARAGVQAGRRGGFARVIGVARSGDPQPLLDAGADTVVQSLSELRVVSGAERDRALAELPSALENLDELVQRIGRRRIALFLDFDGTLAPIVDRPEQARLPEETREVLRDLATRHPVAIVSGRDLDDLRGRVGLERVYYAGSHGFRLAGPDGWSQEPEQARRFLPALDDAEKRLCERLGSLDGVQLERKRYAIALHFRRAGPGAVDRLREVAQEVCEQSDELALGEGRKVLELRPALDWDKGRAVGVLLEALDLDAPEVFPVYIGDDVTDEDAFRAVQGEGLAVAVRGREGTTRASLALEDPAAVRDFLARLDRELSAS